MLFRFLIVASCFSLTMASYSTSAQAKLYNTPRAKEAQTDEGGNSAAGRQGGYGLGKDSSRGTNRTTQEGMKKQREEEVKNLNLRVMSHIRAIRDACLSKWDGQGCMKSLSALNMETASFYAESLDAAGVKDSEVHLETLKQHCAASTAALKVDVPAYAMRSAMTECVNTISDITEETAVKPDVNMYQLMVGSVLCLQGDKQCKFIEHQLGAVK